MHDAALRDLLRDPGLEESHKLGLRFAEVTEDTLGPFYRRPGTVEAITAAGGRSPRYPDPGPSRAHLLSAIGAS